MMLKRTLLVFFASAALVACEPSERASSPTEGDVAAADSVGPAAYAERLLFLPSADRDGPAALFEFGAIVDSAGVQRSMRAWTAAEGGWTVLDSADWRMESMREPWRLVPYGPVRLIVDDGGEIETLVYRGDAEPFRLLAGETMGEWSPSQRARLRLRRAELVTDDGARSGVLIDAHFRLAPPTAPAERGVRAAYLTDGRAVHLVLLDGVVSEGAGWMREGARSRNWRGVRIEPTAFRPAPANADAPAPTADTSAGPPRLPTAWRVEVDGAAIGGDLELVGASGANGLFRVEGTLDIEGRSHRVHGVVRHGAA